MKENEKSIEYYEHKTNELYNDCKADVIHDPLCTDLKMYKICKYIDEGLDINSKYNERNIEFNVLEYYINSLADINDSKTKRKQPDPIIVKKIVDIMIKAGIDNQHTTQGFDALFLILDQLSEYKGNNNTFKKMILNGFDLNRYIPYYNKSTLEIIKSGDIDCLDYYVDRLEKWEELRIELDDKH